MKVGIAADHAGFELKTEMTEFVKSLGYDLKDYGAFSYDSGDDYPDLIIPLARAVANGEVERGIAICGSGVGASIVANKINGVRAALIEDHYSAHQGVEHDDMNIICIGARISGSTLVAELLKAFLAAKFTNEERHVRRLKKIRRLEEE
jgi:ribose 5-phosphate isomerase B